MTGTMQMSIEQYNAMAERLAYLEQKLAEREWIPVSESLPEGIGDVLAWDSMDMFVARCIDGKWFSYDSLYEKEVPIVAWMPLPPSYQGE